MLAKIRQYDVDGAGNIVLSGSVSIKGMLSTHKEWRVVPDDANPNTAGYPTIADFLDLEHAAGRSFVGGSLGVLPVLVTQSEGAQAAELLLESGFACCLETGSPILLE